MESVLDITVVVGNLRVWSDGLRLTERAVAAWEREYVEQLARPISGPRMPRTVAAEFISHVLEFARRDGSVIPPRVVTLLQLTVVDGHCVVGTFELETDLDGVSRGTRLDLTPLGDDDWTAEYDGPPGGPF